MWNSISHVGRPGRWSALAALSKRRRGRPPCTCTRSGLYVPTDPGGVDENAKRGALSLNFGRLFEKGLRLATGQCNVKRYNAYLRDMIIAGKAKPGFVVSHTVSLDDATDAYVKFDKRIDGYTKVILTP